MTLIVPGSIGGKSVVDWVVPQLSDCAPQIEPCEYQVLIRMAVFPEASPGGVIFSDAMKAHEQWGSAHARLVAVSPHAFSYVESWPAGAMPQVGDVVYVGKYPGDEVLGRDGHKYRLCSDREIRAVIERAQAQVEALNAA